ncbi:branched-chain amino acid ABC transporter ATP-binding protein/permease [Azospirillum sp.]|uniref:branched-chain amino acid ABC transporter ATP-binding protein/permease n=1 Tax=Azospirillum sp. TaxID=34012 RepID=UPI002D54CC5F|nr:branched-chain amino acid ABC transporter ATP-binding protein/permease [Azospirillum sp.]HYD70281.1 branched-chain amino acid ABC transporter ATP-binding protein/permease [Azospirillum sp.]
MTVQANGTSAAPGAGAPSRPLARLTDPRFYVSVAALSLFLLVPLGIGQPFFTHIAITICTYAALATAWNIVGGFTGQLSLGHTIFYGIGAYTAALLAIHYNLTPWIGMFAGAAIAAVVGIAISYPCFRLRGPFFALSTIAFLEVTRLLALHEKAWTGGAAGLIVPLRLGWEWMIFRDRMPSLIIAFGLLVLTLLVSVAIRNSRMGSYLDAVREREDAAQAMGINTVMMKIWAVVISAALTAMIGTFHAMYVTFVEPAQMFSLPFAVQIAMFALIGGVGTVAGPLTGTLLVVPLTEMARVWLGAGATGLHGFVYGVVLIAVVLLLPHGIVGAVGERVAHWVDGLPGGRRRRPEPPLPALPPAYVRNPEGRTIGEPILRAHGLTKRFGGLLATNNVSVELRRGEVLGIIGPNGAGKTTLFNLLSGFLTPNDGTVEVIGPDGSVLRPRQPHQFAAAGVGRTFQIVQPFGQLSVLENIMVGAFRVHPGVDEAKALAMQIAGMVGLAEERDTLARNLTIGGLKRLEVARVLAMKPRILLLDEVMAGQSRADVERSIAMINAIREAGVSIIAIEHVMHAIMSISDRVLVISSGAPLLEGTPQEVVNDPRVIEAYLGKEYTHAHAH